MLHLILLSGIDMDILCSAGVVLSWLVTKKALHGTVSFFSLYTFALFFPNACFVSVTRCSPQFSDSFSCEHLAPPAGGQLEERRHFTVWPWLEPNDKRKAVGAVCWDRLYSTVFVMWTVCCRECMYARPLYCSPVLHFYWSQLLICTFRMNSVPDPFCDASLIGGKTSCSCFCLLLSVL